MKKKLLIIIHSLKRGGGAETLASNLTIHLSKKYNIFILTVYHFKNLYPYIGHYYSLKENLGVMRKILAVTALFIFGVLFCGEHRREIRLF